MTDHQASSAGQPDVSPSGNVHRMTPTIDIAPELPPGTSTPAGPEPDTGSSGTSDRNLTPVRHRTPLGDRVDNAYAYAVLIAPLAVAGWFQSHAAHARLDLPWGWAVAFTLAWEGAAGYVARLYLRALLRGDSAVVLRLAMLGYAAASCGLLWWDLDHRGKEPHLALAVGVLALSGIFLWVRRARDLRRDDLHARGLVDAQVVKFGFASWVAAPLETPAALRFAIKNRISHPVEAIEAYRHDRNLRKLAKLRKRMRLDRNVPTAADRKVRPEVPVVVPAPVAPEVPVLRDAELPPGTSADLPPELPVQADAEVPVEVPVEPSAPDTPEVPVIPPPGTSGGSFRNNGRRTSAGSSARKQTRRGPEPKPRRTADETRKLAADLLAKKPKPTQAAVARELNITDRRLRDVLNKATPSADDEDRDRVNGSHPDPNLIGALP